MSTTRTTRLRAASAAGLLLILVLLFFYCGPSSRETQRITAQPAPGIEAVPVPVPVPADDRLEATPPAAQTSAPGPPSPVALPDPLLSETIPLAAIPAVKAPAVKVPVAAPPPTPARNVPAYVTAAPPWVEAQPVEEPSPAAAVPDPDLLIADAASNRFRPDVAATAFKRLSAGTPIQSDAHSLGVLEPCDTGASACAGGLAPGQAVGTGNDWTGFVLPGF
jgi:hypothetical protein